jgi:hypothetical protein
VTNPNYFTERDENCGEVKLDYTIQSWESPASTVRRQLDERDHDEEDVDFGLRPIEGTARGRGGGGAAINSDWSIAPEGVFCQRPDIYRKRLPTIPDQFSVKIETVDEVVLF